VEARLEPLVLHELSYVLPRYVKQMTHRQVAQYLLVVIEWDGVHNVRELAAQGVVVPEPLPH